jgi:hypothetical protein
MRSHVRDDKSQQMGCCVVLRRRSRFSARAVRAPSETREYGVSEAGQKVSDPAVASEFRKDGKSVIESPRFFLELREGCIGEKLRVASGTGLPRQTPGATTDAG